MTGMVTKKRRDIFYVAGILVLSWVALSRDAVAANPIPAASPATSAKPPAGFKKVFVVILENEDEQSAVTQPFLAQLARSGALLQQYSGISHPSEPNYLALTSGSTWGIHDDARHTIDATNLGDLLEAKGHTWKSYAEDYPGHCDLRAQIGPYVRKHEPFLSYTDVQQSPTLCAHIVNANELDQDLAEDRLPDFSLYVPNDQNNGHDTGVTFADNWLKSRFGNLLSDPHFIEDTLFVVTFDEADHGNRVYTSLYGSMVRPGFVSGATYDHYSLLRTIEGGLGLETLGRGDSTAKPIEDVFK